MGADKVLAKKIVRGKDISKKKSNSVGHSKRFLAHQPHHHCHCGGHRNGQGGGTHKVHTGKEKSHVGKIVAKKALVEKIHAKKKLVTSEILPKKS